MRTLVSRLFVNCVSILLCFGSVEASPFEMAAQTNSNPAAASLDDVAETVCELEGRFRSLEKSVTAGFFRIELELLRTAAEKLKTSITEWNDRIEELRNRRLELDPSNASELIVINQEEAEVRAALERDERTYAEIANRMRAINDSLRILAQIPSPIAGIACKANTLSPKNLKSQSKEKCHE